MAQLTQDRNTLRKAPGGITAYAVAAGQKIFAGSLVCVNANGYLVPAANTAGLRFVGVAKQFVDNSSGGDGFIICEVWTTGEFEFATAAVARGDINKTAFAVDDQTFSFNANQGVCCGMITGFVSATKAWLCIDPGCRKGAAPIADLAGAPTQADFNKLLAALRSAGILGQ